MRGFVLNADDYALHAPGDDAILALAARGIVTSTTAMVLSPRWREAAARLREAPLDAGLHIDFTSPFAAPPAGRGVGGLIVQSWLRGLPRAAVRESIERQLGLFEDALGRAPSVVDGHQHVQQFPVIRDELLDALERRGASGARPFVRVSRSRMARGAKAALLTVLGSGALMRAARARGYRCNEDFAGVYGFEPQADLAQLWRRWLMPLPQSWPLALMCHVSTSGEPQPGDPISAARLREYAWLASEAFAQLCARCGARPVRWGELLPASAG
jgi:predicted glycoside hydrolase/deacetylase ChbG (UPF0249 family)